MGGPPGVYGIFCGTFPAAAGAKSVQKFQENFLHVDVDIEIS